MFDDDADEGSDSGSMEAVERLMQLIQFLSANEECTRADIFRSPTLASYYGIDWVDPANPQALKNARRKLERDLSALKSRGFEICRRRGSGRFVSYTLVKGSGPTPPFLFAQSEIDALAFLYTIFADPAQYQRSDGHRPLPLPPAPNPFAADMLRLINRLVAVLPAEQKLQFERWTQHPFIYFQLSTVADYLSHRHTIDVIVRAISHHQQIEFEYKPLANYQTPRSHKEIDPYYVLYQDGHFYLICYSHPASKFLEYRIDRILPESLKEMPDHIDAEQRRHPVEFCFWLDSSLAQPGLSQRWLTQVQEREEVRLDADGHERRRIFIRATTYNEWRIIPQLLKYGAKAELVSPPSLRAQMKQELQRISHLYAD